MNSQYLFFKSVFNREDSQYNRYIIDKTETGKYMLIELSPDHKPNLVSNFDCYGDAVDYFNAEFNLELKNI